MAARTTSRKNPFAGVRPFDRESGNCNIIIETPQGSRNKYTFNEKLGLFELGGVLPSGASFPYDFGFIPGTIGEDGDPLDDLETNLLDEIEHFFISYNDIRGKTFKPVGRGGSAEAIRLVRKGIQKKNRR